MAKNDPLPRDVDEVSDLPVFIKDWRQAIERQIDRVEHERNITDGYLLVVAAHQVHQACLQYAEHDPTGEIKTACEHFEAKNPNLRTLRNMLMHFDDYYRGVGNDPSTRGRRVFTYFMNKQDGAWRLAHGGSEAGLCNLSQLATDAIELAEKSVAAPGPGESWLEQFASSEEYRAKGPGE